VTLRTSSSPSHLRLVAKIAMGYRGYGLPIGEVISEGNVGLMQAVKRFEPDKGFRLATYAMWWIRASIQEYILRSWSLVKMGTTAAQKRLFFNLRKAKSRLSALEEGDLKPDQVKSIATRLGVTEKDVIDMNRRLAGDSSLNSPIRADADSGEWQDWLVDEHVDQESTLVESEELAEPPQGARASARRAPPIASGASSRRAASPTTRLRWRNLPANSACRASRVRQIEGGAPSRKCSRRW